MSKRIWVQISATLAVLASRFSKLLPPNLSAVGSLGFFGGNAWLYFASLVAHDVLFGGLYTGFTFTYLGFAMYALLGRVAKNSTRKQALLLPVASLLFFLFSNVGVWWYWYPHTAEGLVRCFTLALPFYRNTVLGDLGFGYGYILFKHFSNKFFTVVSKDSFLHRLATSY